MSFCTQLGTLRETTLENPVELWGNTLVNPQKNILQSIDFMQKLTVIAISNITYQRNIFPESAYSSRNLSGLEIKILKGNQRLPLVQKMTSIIKSALEALPMKYLHKLIFVIEELEVGSKEVYTLNYTYKEAVNYCDIMNDSGEKVEFSPSQSTDTPEEIKMQTEELIRKLNVMIRFKNHFSKKVSMTFRLVLTEGDYNTDLLEHNVFDSTYLTGMFHSYNMTLLPVKATHFTNTLATLLDIIAISDPMRVTHHRQIAVPDVPEEFQLEFFKHCEEIPSIDFPTGSNKLKLGKVTTQFHTLTSTNLAVDIDPTDKENKSGSGNSVVENLTLTNKTSDAVDVELDKSCEEEQPKPKIKRLLRKIKGSKKHQKLR